MIRFIGQLHTRDGRFIEADIRLGHGYVPPKHVISRGRLYELRMVEHMPDVDGTCGQRRAIYAEVDAVCVEGKETT